jgi:hypothetical protein
MLKIEKIDQATTWDKSQLWEPDKNLLSKLVNEEISLPNAKFFKIGEKILISISHGDRLKSKKIWTLYGDLSRKYEGEVEAL